ncbi:MAG: 2-iminoacetate synthase ThiH [Victivallales bacterium]|jgi:2-iminoacetate synthase|nr:2-iminoacetate synthase ThiH [Victivallales bacterium]MBT7301591.1 2-iminoacetate synthase ThiH [Victivallales bacterium]
MTYLDSSFAEVLAAWPVERVLSLLAGADEGAVHTALARGVRSEVDLAALLAPCAAPQLETMAQRAASLTRQRFGRAIQFYAPLYVSNHCVNGCTYCGFNCRNHVARRRLTVEEASHEVRHLADEGFRHILLVSGEDPKGVPVPYFEELARNLHPHVASLNIEIQPLSIPDYALLVQAGVDTLTLYQETYAPVEYARYHVSGPKRDFRWRLEAPERGAQAGMAFLGIGALLGLTDWRVEAFYVGLHARYLQRTYWRQHVSVSFPRMQHAAGAFEPPFPVGDADLVQILCALRLALPDAGMVLSTRESAALRDHLLPIGITRLSAGSKTTPGGYAEDTEAEGQFDVQDHRSLAEVMAAVQARGFDPVCKDWDGLYHEDVLTPGQV